MKTPTLVKYGFRSRGVRQGGKNSSYYHIVESDVFDIDFVERADLERVISWSYEDLSRRPEALSRKLSLFDNYAFEAEVDVVRYGYRAYRPAFFDDLFPEDFRLVKNATESCVDRAESGKMPTHRRPVTFSGLLQLMESSKYAITASHHTLAERNSPPTISLSELQSIDQRVGNARNILKKFFDKIIVCSNEIYVQCPEPRLTVISYINNNMAAYLNHFPLISTDIEHVEHDSLYICDQKPFLRMASSRSRGDRTEDKQASPIAILKKYLNQQNADYGPEFKIKADLEALLEVFKRLDMNNFPADLLIETAYIRKAVEASTFEGAMSALSEIKFDPKGLVNRYPEIFLDNRTDVDFSRHVDSADGNYSSLPVGIVSDIFKF